MKLIKTILERITQEGSISLGRKEYLPEETKVGDKIIIKDIDCSNTWKVVKIESDHSIIINPDDLIENL